MAFAAEGSMAEERTRLGRGLAALIGDAGEESRQATAPRERRAVPIEFLRPNPRNPRKHFDDAEIGELADSIREKGVLQPILARAIPNVADAYEIIAGERRWRAAQRAGRHEVPVRIVEASDREALEFAIIENVQRADLNAIEEALGYERLQNEFGHTQDMVAKITGKSRSHVANTLRLLKLPEATRALVVKGEISAGHARALLSVEDPQAVAKRIVEEGLTVRDVEHIAQAQGDRTGDTPTVAKRSGAAPKDADTRALETLLSEVLGLTVTIKNRGEQGDINIRYRSLDQLEGLCQKLKA
jgi:ParB family chromosome partitioning protein